MVFGLRAVRVPDRLNVYLYTVGGSQMQDAAADQSDLLAFWGKSSKESRSEYHPVVHHFADVARVAGLLWRECLGDALQRSVEADIGVNDQIAELVTAFLAGLHDLGKVSPVFQRLQPRLATRLADAGYILGSYRTNRSPHGIITARELRNVVANGESEVCANHTMAGILAKIAGAHHGVFANAYDTRHLASDSLGDSKWADARSRLAAHLWLMLNNGEETSVELATDDLANPATVPVLAGLISVADWIGSNIDYFPLDSQTEPAAYFQKAARNAEEALAKIGWLPAPAYAEPVQFEQLFPFRSGPNEMQRTVAELAKRQNGPFLLAIEAQMGQGKTEAALYAADYSLCVGRSRGLYVALPTQATSNAMFSRVTKDYLKGRGHANIQESMQLVHGNALLQNIMQVSDVSEDEDGIEHTVSARSWFTARKRPLLAPFGVGTIDQALLGVLQTRHWFVRLFGLANKVVIFDEVHAYDTYTSTLLDHLIKWLAALQCTVVLLSATLPRKRLSELVQAYGGTQLAEVADYPRITLATRGECSCIHIGENSGPKPVSLEFKSDDPVEVAQLVSSRLSDGGCAAVICNTVDRAPGSTLRLDPDLGGVI